MQPQSQLRFRTSFFAFFLFTFFIAQAQYKDAKDYVASDVNQEFPAKYPWEKNAKYKNYTRETYYLVMRDSVKIAVDVYIPKVKKWRDNKDGSDKYQVDSTTTMGMYVKFRSVSGQLKTPHVYPNRAMADSLLLVYDSEPLQKDMEVTGHPLVNLFLSSNTTDAQVFVYLEDVDENGTVHYVTEGELRALHRKVRNDKLPYKQIGPYHSFEKEDGQPLISGEVVELTFSMLPISYLFKKGHKVRIAIAGADADQFCNMTNDEPEYTLHRSFQYPSRVELPVVR